MLFSIIKSHRHNSLLSLLATVIGCSLTVTSLQGGIDDATPYNPPEFYDQIRAKRKSILDEQRATIDLTTHPRYQTVVTNGDDLLRVDRLTYSFEIDKHNGVVHKAQLLDVVADQGCALGDLELVDAKGKTYRQSLAENGSVTVLEEPTYLFWTALFSPADQRGKSAPVTIEASYQLFKMSGLVTVRYKVLEGSIKVKRVRIQNTLGVLPVNLSIAHSAFFLDNEDRFNDTLTVEASDTKDGVIATGKIVGPFWTNGRIGFHAVALQNTWRQVGPLDCESPLKRTAIHTENGQRHLDFFFINTDQPVALETGSEMESGFALLPFQRYQPTLPLVGKVELSYQFDYLKSGEEADFQQVVRNFRHTFWSGAIFCGTGLASAGWTPLMYAVTKEPYYERTKKIRDLGRQCDLTLGTASCYVNNWPGIPGLPPHGGVEENAYEPRVLEAMKEMAAFFNKEGYVCSLSTPEVRDFWLDVRTSTLEVLDVDADYEDLHAHIDVGGGFDSQIEGEMRYQEDVALLHESYGGRRKLVAHAGNILTAADSVNGATWPGEPWTGQNFDRLPTAVLDILLNPFLIGTDVCFYGNNDIYNLESLELCKQLLRNSVVPQYAALSRGFGGSILKSNTVKSEAAREAWEKYFVPARTFRTDLSSYVSWRDPAAREYFTVKGDDHKINLYYRDHEAYVTCVEMGTEPTRPEIKFNVAELGFQGDEAFVFNLLTRKLSVVPVEDGWIEYSPEATTAEPVLLYLKQKPNDAPTVIWARYPIKFDNTKNDEASPVGSDLSSISWKYTIPVFPLELKQELVRIYVGKLGRPRSYAPWGVAYVHKFYPDEQSLDLTIQIAPAKEGGPVGGAGAGGADGVSGQVKLGFDKAFQLSFPYLGE
jgi:hypothetical protein